MTTPLSFTPDKTEFDKVSIEAYNSMSEEFQFAQKELEETQEELMRARQKIAHLLKEIEELKAQ